VTPVVEVTVPAYGDGLLLRSAVRSVLAQDSAGWLLTVVDDGRVSCPVPATGEALHRTAADLALRSR